MLVSTKGRYALRVMLDLAEHQGEGYLPLAAIAERQEISEKYLESILAVLSKAGLLLALRGKHGGYQLARKPEEYTAYDVLELTEGSLSPVTCLDKAGECPRACDCLTLPMWQGLNKTMTDYLKSWTLADPAGEQT